MCVSNDLISKLCCVMSGCLESVSCDVTSFRSFSTEANGDLPANRANEAAMSCVSMVCVHGHSVVI